MDKRTAIKIVTEYLLNLKNRNIVILNAYIFGSFINGNFHKDSDIDLAVIFEDIINDPIEMQIKLMMLRNAEETIIEPHPFDLNDFNSGNPFAEEIKRTGLKIL